jgi:hypothetical protein
MSYLAEYQYENVRLRKENAGLKQKLDEIDKVLANNNAILHVFYQAIEESTDVAGMYGYCEVGLGNVPDFVKYTRAEGEEE